MGVFLVRSRAQKGAGIAELAPRAVYVWGQRTGVEIIKTKQGGDPSAVLFDALNAAKSRATDVLLVDTAGRLHTKNDLMKELDKMRRTTQRTARPGVAHAYLARTTTTDK